MPPTLEAPKRLKEHSLAADLRFNPQGRRRPTFLVASALLVVVCGASFAAAYGRAGHQTSVLAVSTMVPQGAVIVASDLASVHISLTPSIRTIPASDASSVIGRTATVGLVAGSILVDSDFASTSSPPSGRRVRGNRLEARAAARFRPISWAKGRHRTDWRTWVAGRRYRRVPWRSEHRFRQSRSRPRGRGTRAGC